MKFVLRLSAACGLLLLVGPVQALTLFSDDFENGVGGDIVWAPWGNVSGESHTPNGFNNLVTTDTSHALSGTHSARAWEADPADWNGFADFGATGAGLRATVYLYEDMTYVPPYLDQPTWKQPAIEVRSMFSLFGDSPTGRPDDLTDYLEIRTFPDLDRDIYDPNNPPPPDHYSYGIETKYNDDQGLGIIDTGVLRKKSQWMKLAIEADSMADGGQVRFFIDDALVGTSYRSGPDLRWVMMGATKITYENYWYDDISVGDLHGNYNGDGITDAADYVVWRKNNGTTALYDTWRANFGTVAALGSSSTAVPEPTTASSMCMACGILLAGNCLRNWLSCSSARRTAGPA